MIEQLSKAWCWIQKYLAPKLDNLDPSLFQNVILGFLTIFIPFSIVFLTKIVDSSDKKSDFERMVFSEEALKVKSVFFVSAIGIGIFAFFSNQDAVTKKIFGIVLIIGISLFMTKVLFSILRFSEGNKLDFEKNFLKKLTLSKRTPFLNTSRAIKMSIAWESFWSVETHSFEWDYTQIFIKHIDSVMGNNRYSTAISISKDYLKNIDKRAGHSISMLLPKLFMWNESLKKAKNKYFRKLHLSKRLRQIAVSRWMINRFKRRYRESDYLEWHYFSNIFFPEVAKNLLLNGQSYEFFESFKNYLNNAKLRLQDKNLTKWPPHLKNLFESFFPMFFSNSLKFISNYQMWEDDFPNEWKIKAENSENLESRIVLQKFLNWAHDITLKDSSSVDYEAAISTVTSGLFPGANKELLSTFITFYFGGFDILHTLKKDKYIYIFDFESLSERSIKEKQTIEIIFKYFLNTNIFEIDPKDFSETQLEESDSYTEEQKYQILWKQKWQNILNKLESEEVINLCREREDREEMRKNIKKLLELMIEKVS